MMAARCLLLLVAPVSANYGWGDYGWGDYNQGDSSGDGSCADTCSGATCDDWTPYGYDCDYLESTFGCDCSGCSTCDAIAPPAPPTPPPAPVCEGENCLCEETCYMGYFASDGTCDDGGEGAMYSSCDLGARTHARTHAPARTPARTHAPTHPRTHASTHPPTHPRTHVARTQPPPFFCLTRSIYTHTHTHT